MILLNASTVPKVNINPGHWSTGGEEVVCVRVQARVRSAQSKQDAGRYLSKREFCLLGSWCLRCDSVIRDAAIKMLKARILRDGLKLKATRLNYSYRTENPGTVAKSPSGCSIHQLSMNCNRALLSWHGKYLQLSRTFQ